MVLLHYLASGALENALDKIGSTTLGSHVARVPGMTVNPSHNDDEPQWCRFRPVVVLPFRHLT